MNKICCLFFLISLFAYQSKSLAIEAEEITYEWLVEYEKIDHVPHFRKIFNFVKVKTFLEFGLGYSTKYFLDSCNKVISVEYITATAGPDLVKRCLELYASYSNWVPVTYFTSYYGDVSWAPYKYLGTDSICDAAYYQCENHLNYALIDDSYLKELGTFIENITKYNKVGIAFIHSGLLLRGDLVQLLFGKVPIILADDFAHSLVTTNDVYGYSRIETPDNYEQIYFQSGAGTMAWVLKRNEYEELIQELKIYANALKQ